MGPGLCSDPAAGFKPPQWRKGGDTASQATTLTSGSATTQGGSPRAEEMLGSSTLLLLLLQVGCPQQGREAPGTVGAPEHFPQPQEHHAAPTNPICTPVFSRIPCWGTALQAFCRPWVNCKECPGRAGGWRDAKLMYNQTDKSSELHMLPLHPSLQ